MAQGRDSKGRFVALGAEAEDAADALAGLGDAAQQTDSALAGLGAATSKADSALAGLGSHAARAESSLGKLNAKAAKAGDAAKGGSINLKAMGRDLSDIGGSKVGGAANQLAQIGDALQGFAEAGPVGIVAALTVALAALAVAAIGAAFAIGKFALEMANARLAEHNMFEGLLSSASGATELQGSIDRLTGKLPQTRKELEALATKLAKTGLRGKELDSALQKAATEAAVKKYGSVANGLLDLDVQLGKAKESVSALFRGVVAGPFLKALQSLLSLFDQNTASGRALAAAFSGIGNALLSIATGALPYIKTALLQIIIWGLKAYIALKQFGNSPWGQLLVTGLKAVAVAIGVVVAVAAVAGTLLALPFVLMAAAVGAVIVVIGSIIEAVVSVASAISSAFDGIDLVQIGSDMIAGLANGIMSAGGAVLSAITGVVGGAIDSAKALLGIHSPSKVFEGIGKQTAAGFGGGVDKGAPQAATSMSNMLAPPQVAPPSGSSSTVNGGGITVIVQGAADPVATGNEVIRQIRAYFEGLRLRGAT